MLSVSIRIPVSSEIWFHRVVRSTALSASLKRSQNLGGDRVDYSDPSLNGGRSNSTNQTRSRAYYVVNYGLIVLLGVAIVAFFLTSR